MRSFFCLAFLLVQSGCATFPKGPTPEDRVSFGTIGVSRASFLPETEFAVPAKGRPDGAVKGAGIAFFDTVLEVALLRIALGSKEWGSNPPLKFTLKARCRLVRVPDGTVIDDHEYRTLSVYRKFSVWGADNAALLGREYEEGYRKLVADIVQRIFLAPPPK